MAIAGACSDKKALDIVLMNMKKVSGVSDYFVIASGGSTTQTRAIADHIVRVMKAKGERVRHVEGLREASWVLIDCTDVVAHIFLKDTRHFYDLESLWKKAPLLHWKELDKAPKERFAGPGRKKARAFHAFKKKKKRRKVKRPGIAQNLRKRRR